MQFSMKNVITVVFVVVAQVSTTSGGSVAARSPNVARPNSPIVPLAPAIHPAVDRSSYANLIPSTNYTLFYAAGTNPNKQTPRNVGILKVPRAQYAAVELVHSAFITDIQCTSDTALTIKFNDSIAYATAKKSWTRNTILILYQSGCGNSSDDSTRTYHSIQAVHPFGNGTRQSLSITAKVVDLKTAVGQEPISLNFGALMANAIVDTPATTTSFAPNSLITAPPTKRDVAKILNKRQNIGDIVEDLVDCITDIFGGYEDCFTSVCNDFYDEISSDIVYVYTEASSGILALASSASSDICSVASEISSDAVSVADALTSDAESLYSVASSTLASVEKEVATAVESAASAAVTLISAAQSKVVSIISAAELEAEQIEGFATREFESILSAASSDAEYVVSAASSSFYSIVAKATSEAAYIESAATAAAASLYASLTSAFPAITPTFDPAPMQISVDTLNYGSPVDTPWDIPGYLLYSYNNHSAEFDVYCAGCDIKTDLTLSGEIVLVIGLDPRILTANVDLDGAIGASINLGLYAQYNNTWDYSKQLFQVGLPGFSIEDILTIGPSVAMSVDATLNLEIEGAALAGISATWPNISLSYDLINSGNSGANGFGDVKLEPLVQLEASANIDALLTTTLSVEFGIDIGPSSDPLLHYDISMNDQAGVLFNASVSAYFDYSNGTISTGGGTDECPGVGLGMYFVNEAYLDIFDKTTLTFEATTIPMYATCVSLFGPPGLPQTTTSDTTPTTCPTVYSTVYVTQTHMVKSTTSSTTATTTKTKTKSKNS